MTSYTSSLTSTVEALKSSLDGVFEDETSRIGDTLTERIAYHTPVGRRVNMDTGDDAGESGALKRAWKKQAVRRADARKWETGSKNDKDYTTFVNDGTRAHIIEPKAERRMRAAAEGRNVALRFWGRGEMMFRARVHHPGTRGRYMVQQGSMDVERSWPPEADARMAARAREAEVRGDQTAIRG